MFGGNTFGQLGLGVKPVACKPASVRGQSLNFITHLISFITMNTLDLTNKYKHFHTLPVL